MAHCTAYKYQSIRRLNKVSRKLAYIKNEKFETSLFSVKNSMY